MAFLPQPLNLIGEVHAASPNPTYYPNAIGPGRDPFTIGVVTTSTIEAPRELELGQGEHVIAANETIGGGKVVQKFGAQMGSINVGIRLWQPDIDAKFQTLQAYMVLGLQVAVTWRIHRYQAIVKKFKPRSKNANQIDVDLELEIVSDDNGAFSSAAGPSLDKNAALLMGQAASQNVQVLQAPVPPVPPPSYGNLLGGSGGSGGSGGGGNSAFSPLNSGGVSPSVSPTATPIPLSPQTFQAALGTLQLTLKNAGPLAQLSGGNLTTVNNAAAAAVTAVQTYLASIPTTSAPYLPATQLLTTLQLVAKSIARGQAPRSVSVTGGDLWTVSLRYYGTTKYADALAQVNGLPCVILPAQVATTIVLPPYKAA